MSNHQGGYQGQPPYGGQSPQQPPQQPSPQPPYGQQPSQQYQQPGQQFGQHYGQQQYGGYPRPRLRRGRRGRSWWRSSAH
ncbi:hypothetical protein [Kribbella sp. NPDC048915]|uniref:hypothetical protein n=1 Tax=Kribbella sp. NPDC048915 TaxID=3155148 RepID=UPI00340CE6D7